MLRGEAGITPATEPARGDAASQPQLPLDLTSARGPIGFVWIGSAEAPLLLDHASNARVRPDQIQTGETYRVPSTINMSLRSSFPTAQNVPGRLLGVAPNGGLVEAMRERDHRDRPSGRQYWLRVRVLPRIYIQYDGPGRATVGRVEQALQRAGFDVRPSEQRPYRDRPRIRFFHEQDRQIAAAVQQLTFRTLNDGAARPPALICELYIKGQRPLPTILEIWIDTRPSDPGNISRVLKHDC